MKHSMWISIVSAASISPVARYAALHALLMTVPVFLCGSATAQVLQDGDMVIAAHRVGNGGIFYGRFLRLRGQDVSILFESGESGNTPEVFGGTTDIIIDSHGRVVFAAGACGSNSNNNALLRWDPATGQVSELLCIPYIVPPEGPPTGFPTDAAYFGGVSGLHLTRSLRVSIDDDVNGGTPQAGYVEAYAFAVATTTYTPGLPFPYETRQESLRYLPDTGQIEPGIAYLEQSGNNALMFADDGATYYGFFQGARIYRAEADLSIDVRAHTTVGGTDVLVSGRLRLAGKNELVIDSRVLDNTAIPNGTATCDPLSDTNVPFDGNTTFRGHGGMHSLGVLDGGIFITAPDGWRYLFNLGPRGPFLNPYCCCYWECNQGYGPHENALPDPPGFSYSTVHNGRILGSNAYRVFAVDSAGYELLATDSLLLAPGDVAPYPAQTPAVTAATLVVRVDSPVNVLVTDAAGRRIGHDAAGNTVNDFGASGAILALEPEGHPRVYAVISPQGDYTLNAVGTGDGPYTLRAYRADTSGEAAIAALSGMTSSGAAETIALRLPPGAGVSLARLSRADFDADGDVDGDDFIVFRACAAGPARPYAPTCTLPPDGSGHIAADFDLDGDADSDDFAAFQRCHSGDGNPADPNCACQADETACSGSCVNVLSDIAHCGACGNACDAGQICQGGSCEPCPGGGAVCGGGCVDLNWDSRNCGACGGVCPEQTACAWGVCEGLCIGCN